MSKSSQNFDDLRYADHVAPQQDLRFVDDAPVAPTTETGDTLRHTAFWGHLFDGIKGTREGGAKIVIDAENSALGSGKTSAAIALARTLSDVFDYELTTDDLTLSGDEYIKRYREHPGRDQPSVLLLDEAVGAGAGDARRAMAQSNLDLASAWQTARVKRVVTLVTVGHWGDLDKRLKRLADYRLRCSERPIGEYATYKVTTEFASGSVRTKKLDAAIQFPDVSAYDCRFYDALDEMKAELLDAKTWDADDLGENDQQEQQQQNEDTVDFDEHAKQVIEDIDEYQSTHGTTGEKIVDKDLIRTKRGLTHADARAVKKKVEKATAPA